MWNVLVGELRNGRDFVLPELGERLLGRLPARWVSARASRPKLCSSVGRSSRTRCSMVPSSSIRLAAGSCTAARLERVLTRSRPDRGSARQSRAHRPAPSGRMRSLRATVRHAGLRARGRMRVDGAAIGDVMLSAVIVSRPLVVGAGGDRALDLRGQQLLEHFEQRFWVSMRSASRRLSQVVIGGSSSRKPPSSVVSDRPGDRPRRS